MTTLYIAVPCFNEEEVLPKTSKLFLEKINQFISQERINDKSRILFINDGSKDKTWNIICDLCKQDHHFAGISLSRNRGHQNALLAGLMTAKEMADIVISIDCDGQDDVNAMDEMLTQYESGCDIVYGVRSSRATDTFFKRTTAQGFYKLMSMMGVESVYNHADYRLMSKRALEGLAQFDETTLFLRGLVPLIGYRTGIVYYERSERIAGKSHYPLKKMLNLALNGITSLSVKPIKLISELGIVICIASFVMIIWCIIRFLMGSTVTGWSSLMCIVLFLGGVQLLCTGIIGEYIGKTYSEVKHRPRYIISESSLNNDENK